MSSHTDEAAPDRAAAPAAQERWSRAAPWLSRLTALLGIAFAAAFLWQAGVFALLLPRGPGKLPEIADPTLAATGPLKVTGFDKDHRPYWIAAESGIQDTQHAGIFNLSKLTAQFSQANDAVLDISADRAAYNKRRDRMDLSGNVHFVQGQRFTAVMDTARLMIADKALSSESAVTVTTGSGTIRSQGMQITDDGNKILFFNGVHVTFGGPPATGGKTP